jgi:hypothetical protein
MKFLGEHIGYGSAKPFPREKIKGPSLGRLRKLMDKKRLKKLEKKNGQKDQKSPQRDGQKDGSSCCVRQA